jgi:GrpB-like predicted nucleotidyltransferase (UPF0157 family)
METLEEKVARVVNEEVAIASYDPRWVDAFEQERLHLRACLPADLVKRIEHFGSTAVPGLVAYFLDACRHGVLLRCSSC